MWRNISGILARGKTLVTDSECVLIELSNLRSGEGDGPLQAPAQADAGGVADADEPRQQVPRAGDRRPLHRPGEGQPRQPRLPLLQGLRQRAAGE